jgi:signal transduction histidine kinase
VLSRGDAPSPEISVEEGSPPPHPPQRPPLTARLRPQHWAGLDYAAGALITVVLFAIVLRSFRRVVLASDASQHLVLSLVTPVALLLAAVAGVAVALRRRRPVFALGVLLVGSLVVTALGGPNGASLVYFLPAAYVLYLVAANYEQRKDAVQVLAAVFVTLVADVALRVLGADVHFNPGGAVSIALCVIIAWTAGYTVRQRRRYAVRLQEEAASKAVAQERLRIARELHDVVAHSMSVIAVQAGYGQYVIDTQPGDARVALGAIQATSREALDEMRRMLGALRHADEGDAPDAGAGSAARIRIRTDAEAGADRAGSSGGPGAPLLPAPGLVDLDRLVSRTAGAGVQVGVTCLGDPRGLPASIDLSAYRIVQEALTNVVKHAQTSSCQVVIGYGDDELTVEVIDNGAGVPVPETANAGPVPEMAGAGVAAAHHGSGMRALTRHDGSLERNMASGHTAGGHGVGRGRGRGIPGGIPGGGHGIIGMRERVSLLGGEFSAGPLPGYGFRVSARIPLPSGGL